jgi:hypothetical protein
MEVASLFISILTMLGLNPCTGAIHPAGHGVVLAVANGPGTFVKHGEKVLTGCLPAERVRLGPAHCCSQVQPDLNWSRRHLHFPATLQSKAPFYLDPKVTAGTAARDDDPYQGIENSRVLVFVGHGHPDSIEVQGAGYREENVPLRTISPGDKKVRYFWAHSCNIMAHGPARSSTSSALPGAGVSCDYPTPWLFGTNTTDTNCAARFPEQNVYSRWGSTSVQQKSPLHPDLRIACGGSSRLHTGTLLGPWHQFVTLRAGVVESFLFGAQALALGQVPLCLARGPALPKDSPLTDNDFLTDANPTKPGADSFLHIAYPRAEPAQYSLLEEGLRAAGLVGPLALSTEPPALLPVLTVSEMLLPTVLAPLGEQLTGPVNRPYGFRGISLPIGRLSRDLRSLGSLLSQSGTASSGTTADVSLERHLRSGAILISWRPTREQPMPPSLRGLAIPTGWFSDLTGQATAAQQRTKRYQLRNVVRIYVDTVKEWPGPLPDGSMPAPSRTEGCRLVTGSALVSLPGDLPSQVPVLSSDEQLTLGSCPSWRLPRGPGPESDVEAFQRRSPALASVTYLERPYSIGSPLRTIRRDTAIVQAKAQIQQQGYDPAAYSLRETSTWGYRAAPIHCSQSKMFAVYRLDFIVTNTGDDQAWATWPPITIEVPAHDLSADPDFQGKRIEDFWDCSPQPVP